MIREIEVFRALMTSGSAARAASLLGVSQPAVSQALRRLEDQAGLRLFERERGRLRPTPEAQAFLIDVERCFSGLDHLRHRLKGLRQFGVGRLRLVSYPALGMGFMPRALARYQRAGHKEPVSLQIMSSREVRERILAGQCDLGLMADESSTAGLEHHLFARVDGVIVMARDHRLARLSAVKATDLRGVPFLSLNPEDMARRRLEEALQVQDVTLTSTIETPYAVTICEFALLGLGVGFVNPVTALPFLERGLVMRRLVVPVSFQCILGMPANHPRSIEATRFMSTMRQQLADDLSTLEQHLNRKIARR